MDTRFDDRALSEVADILKRPGPYAPYYGDIEAAMKGAFAAGKVKPEVVARVVVNAIESRRPKAALPDHEHVEAPDPAEGPAAGRA